MKICPVCKKKVYIGLECDTCHSELVVIPDNSTTNAIYPNPKSKLYISGCVLFCLYMIFSFIGAVGFIRSHNQDLEYSFASLVLPHISYGKIFPLIAFLIVLFIVLLLNNRIVLLFPDKKGYISKIVENVIPILCSAAALIQCIYLIVSIRNMSERYESVFDYGVSNGMINTYNKIMCWTAFGEATLLSQILNISAIILFIINFIFVLIDVKNNIVSNSEHNDQVVN